MRERGSGCSVCECEALAGAGTTTAPLYKAMLDSGLGAALMGTNAPPTPVDATPIPIDATPTHIDATPDAH